MTFNEKRNKFLLDFKEKYPDFKIIKFTNLTSEIIIEDKDGFKYRKSQAFETITRNINIFSIIDKEEYIRIKLKNIFPNLNLIKYNGMKKNVLVEDENGFQYTPQCYDLLQGHKISIETCTKKDNLFIFKANLKHNNEYIYLPFRYYNGKQKIKIKCKTHGVFEQTIESHLFGSGCPRCSSIGFSKEAWINKIKNKEAIFYILRVFNNNEEFIKVGITSKSVSHRYRHLKGYEYEIIKEIIDTPSNIYDMEKRILKEYKDCKIAPKLPFEGKTECLNINCLTKIKKI